MARNYSPVQIENEQAYNSAIQRRIKANRAKTGRAKWLAAHEDAQRLYDWLNNSGEFSYIVTVDPRCGVDDEDGYADHCEVVDGKDYRCKCRTVQHPVAALAKGLFIEKMRDAIDEWGGLTDGQTKAVREALARAEGRVIERNEKREAQDEADRANSKHVGTVGERVELTLTCERNFSYNTQFGTTYVNICRDADGNVIVYKGTNEFQRGSTYTGKATIKAHDQRNGVAQTLIARPSFK